MQRIVNELQEHGTSKGKAFGNSMMPLIKSGSTMSYAKQENYEVDDIVICKVKGKIFCHLIKGKRLIDDKPQYLIGNNKGKINGWTFHVYGKVIMIEEPK